MIEHLNTDEIAKNIKELKSNSENIQKMIDQLTTEEDKDSEEYKRLIEEDKKIKEQLENLFEEEDKQELKKLNEIETFLNYLRDSYYEQEDPNTRDNIQRQINLIEQSYKLDLLLEPNIKPTMGREKLVENYMALRRQAEKKLEDNEHFKFLSVLNIESMIKEALPPELNHKSKIVTAYIYAFIKTVSLKPSGYAIFVFFLIKNLYNLDKNFKEREEFIFNLIRITNLL